MPEKNVKSDVSGFVMIPREVLDWDFWQDPWSVTLWLFCMLNASHNRYKSLQPGQFYTSRNSLMNRLKWSRNTVISRLKNLSECQLIQLDDYDNHTVITVSYWNEMVKHETILTSSSDESPSSSDEYPPLHGMNIPSSSGEYPSLHGMNTPSSSGEYPPLHEMNTTNNNIPIRNQDDSTKKRSFEDFWSAYPRKGDRSEAFMLFRNLNVTPDAMAAAVANAKASPEWLKENGKYIPGAVKWLRGVYENFLPKEEARCKRWTRQ